MQTLAIFQQVIMNAKIISIIRQFKICKNKNGQSKNNKKKQSK